jgi:hypothetical protein
MGQFRELAQGEHLGEKSPDCATLEARVEQLEGEVKRTQRVLRRLLDTLEQKFVVGFDDEEHLSSRVL